MKNIQLDENIQELIDKDFVLARALFFLGITYCDYKGSSLKVALDEAGISFEQLNRKMEELHAIELPGPVFFKSFQVDAIVEYLKHAHYVYIKEKIPYITTLIARLDDSGKLTHDLKLIFPYVVEDFIKHIYHEEDSLFYYIQKLYAANDGVFDESVMLELMRKYSISKMASHHQDDDDEMKGIRNLTNNYSVEGIDDKDLKVIFSELKAFETDLFLHARIENEVLFPKALELEAKVAKFVAESVKSF